MLYIPVCPVTGANAAYLCRQRDAFLAGTPGPDFPGGKGESSHEGRPDEAYVLRYAHLDGLRALGFERLDESCGSDAEVRLAGKVNRILGLA